MGGMHIYMDKEDNNRIKDECEPKEGKSGEASEVSVEELKAKLEEVEKKSTEYLAGWQRARADFLNYKKEEIERIEELIAYSKVELILKLLPVLDDFELVEENIPEELKKDENIKGLLQLKARFTDFLRKFGVNEIKSIANIASSVSVNSACRPTSPVAKAGKKDEPIPAVKIPVFNGPMSINVGLGNAATPNRSSDKSYSTKPAPKSINLQKFSSSLPI